MEENLSANKPATTEPNPAALRQPGPGSLKPLLPFAAILAIATLITYWPILSAEFINYDDPYYILNNPYIQKGITWDSLKWTFTANYSSNWHPLTWISHMLDIDLYNLRAGGHHLTNLLFHIANTWLAFFAFYRMTRALGPSAFVAALFALHPLHVESVAWISERKDVLSTFFGLLTIIGYAHYAKKPAVGRYLLVTLLFALGLASKPMLVTLPCLFLLLDFWPLKRLRWPEQILSGPSREEGATLPADVDAAIQPMTARWLVLEKLPWLALSAVSSVLTVWAQAQVVMPLAQAPFSVRATNALVSYATYLFKTFWPVHLAVHYPYAATLSLRRLIAAGVFVLLVSALALLWARRRPYFLTGWFWFLGTLVPVIGLVQVGSQAMADRYSYIPLFGIFIIVAWGAVELAQRYHFQPALPVLALVVLALCIPITRLQVAHWQNSVALFEHAVKHTSGNYISLHNLGIARMDRGDLDGAQRAFAEALRINPKYSEPHNGWARSLMLQNKPAEAVSHYDAAVELAPRNPQFRHNRGLGLAAVNRVDEAIESFKTALTLDPTMVQVHKDLALALTEKGNFQSAVEHLRVYLKAAPQDAEAHLRLGVLLSESAQPAAAAETYTTVLQLRPNLGSELRMAAEQFAQAGNERAATFCFKSLIYIWPDDPETQTRFATFLLAQKQFDQALPHLERALQLRSTARAHYHLAVARTLMGQPAAAVQHYRQALQIEPEWIVALNDLAWIYATSPNNDVRNGAEALRLAERARDLSGGKEARYWGTLDAAYAENGRFEEAIRAAEQARSLAQSTGQSELVEAAEKRLRLYQQRQPYREPQP